MGKPLAVDWTEVRRAAELGVPMREVGERFGIDYAAVRQRCKRENWLIPDKVQALLEKQRQVQRLSHVSPGVTKTPLNATELQEAVTVTAPVTPTAALVAAESLDSIGTQLRHVVASKALSALRKADLASLPIDTWQDAKVAAEVGLKAAGLDNASGPSVNVLFGGTGFGSDPSPPIEIDAAESLNHRDGETDLL